MDINVLIAKRSFNSTVRMKLWKKLAAMIKYGRGVDESIDSFRERELNRQSGMSRGIVKALAQQGVNVKVSSFLGLMLYGPMAFIYDDISTNLSNVGFADACAKWAPPEEIMLIGAGVAGGQLYRSLEDCADLLKSKKGIVGSVVGSLASPAFLFAGVLAILYIVALYMVPEMSELSDPKKWTGSAGSLYFVSSILASPAGAALAGFIALAVIGVFFSMPNWTGRTRLMFENVPPWSIYRLITGSIWLFTVATLLKSGTQLNDVLGSMVEGNRLTPWLSERVTKIRRMYQAKSDIGYALLHLNMHFPDDELIDDLASYAVLPDLDKKLYEIAKDWLTDGVERVKSTAGALNGLAMVLVIGAVAWLAMAMNSVQNQMFSGMGAGF